VNDRLAAMSADERVARGLCQQSEEDIMRLAEACKVELRGRCMSIDAPCL
jgi:hypothetical protein